MRFRFLVFARIRFVAAFSVALLALGFVAHAGTVSGTVRNGTTGKPGAGVEMILIQLQGGMQPVANTKTDASGHYSFDNPNLGAGPMLLRAVYRGVFYHEPIVPGKNTVDVQVFEPTDKASAFAVTAHAVILQPKGDSLTVGEEYNIENKTQPPQAYYRDDGTFRFSLPDGAHLSDVSAVSASGMPIVQTPVDKGKNEQAISYAFRPGTSGVRLTYDVPYPGNQAKLTFTSPYPAARVAFFLPPTMQLSGDGLAPAGQTEGFNVFMRSSVAAGTPVVVSISGTAPPPPADNGAQGAAGGGADASQDPSVNSRADSGSTAPTATATTLPARLDSLKWILVSGFTALFALGLIYLLRRPQKATAAAGSASAAAQAMPIAAPVATATVASPSVASQVNEAVRGSLDELKDSLFRLELRRQAGTIAEQDYLREHARIQDRLRELVKG